MPKPTNPIFNLEYQYQLYLQRIQLSEADMIPEQRVQLKHAFMGACGQMLDVLDKVAELSEKQGVDALADLNKQVHTFWSNELKNSSLRTNGYTNQSATQTNKGLQITRKYIFRNSPRQVGESIYG